MIYKICHNSLSVFAWAKFTKTFVRMYSTYQYIIIIAYGLRSERKTGTDIIY